MALAIVDGRAGVRIRLEALLLRQVYLARVSPRFSAKVIDGSMQGSVSVAADGQIRFLRAHALLATDGHGVFWGKLILGLVVLRQREVRELRKIDSGGRAGQGCGWLIGFDCVRWR